RAGGVGCPVEREAGRVPRREVGLGHRALAVIDDRERLVGQPAAGDATGLVVLARAGPRPAVRPVGEADPELERGGERLVGLRVGPQDEGHRRLSEVVADGLVAGRAVLGEAADVDRGCAGGTRGQQRERESGGAGCRTAGQGHGPNGRQTAELTTTHPTRPTSGEYNTQLDPDGPERSYHTLQPDAHSGGCWPDSRLGSAKWPELNLW